MMVNNETGLVQPIDEIAEIVHENKSIFMSDATQAVGKIPIDLETDKIDLLAFSAHKFYGPKGSGGLYVRRKKPRVILAPLIDGGGHQRGVRSGTLNVPGIVGLGAAAELAAAEMADDSRRIAKLRDLLEREFSKLPNTQINSSDGNRLYNTSNICFRGINATDMINAIKSKMAVSTGSACTSEDQTASHVLTAMGLSEQDAYSSIRFSLGKQTTKAEILVAIDLISERIQEILESRKT